MNFNKKLAVAVSGAILLMAGQFALADSTTDIVDALVGKGVLTEEEGKLISKGHDTQKKAQPTIKEKDGAFILSSPNGKNTVQLTGRMHFDYKASDIDNYGNTDVYKFNNDADTKSTGDHFNMRRARIGIKGRVGGVADYLLLANIQGSSILDEAFLDVNKYEMLGLKFGKFKQPMNLEVMTSSNNIDQIERSYLSQNLPEKRMGAMLHGEPAGFTYAGSIFQNNDNALSQEDKDMSYAGRATVNFAELMGNKDMVIHVGLNGYDSEYQIRPETTGNTSDNVSQTTRGTIFSFTSGGAGLANIFRAQIGGEPIAGASTNAGYHYQAASTSSVKNKKGGLEGILAYKNFKLQGEWGSASYEAKTEANSESIKADADTWYAEALWTLTGEKFADQYKKGAFGLAKPASEFNMDTGTGYGLWEASFRVDAFDVYDGSVTAVTGTDRTRFQGGLSDYRTNVNASNASTKLDTCDAKYATQCQNVQSGAKSYTAGLKWVWNPNLLFKANYTYTKFDNAVYPIDVGPAADRTGANRANYKSFTDENLFMIRGQYMF
jgi:phosphate-selective porin OprO/OprP